MGIEITRDDADKFLRYMSALKDWNTRINLTAITNDEEIITKHFLDSLTIAPLITPSAKIIDVGSGAGFPGIPLAIIRPDLEMLLLDSLNKRINFLNHIISELSLTNIRTAHARAEDASHAPAHREAYDYAIARAMAPMVALAEYCLPYVAVGGSFIAMKGTKCEEELACAIGFIEELGGELNAIHQAQIPHTDITHKLAVFKKIKPTPKKYPRRAKQIGKPTS